MDARREGALMTHELLLENFDELAEAPNGVEKLRELILQLAVQGKLVPQDENDEPAAVLFSQIQAERSRLIAEGVMRRSKPLPPVCADEQPFQIPTQWSWIRFDDVGDWGAGATPNRGRLDYFGGNIKWFKSGELNDAYIDDSEEKITELALKECSLRENEPGDVLVAMYGATIGKVAILNVPATTNQAVCACTCHSGIFNRYLFLMLKAFKPYFISNSSGAAQPNFSKEKIVRTPFPLPPLAEQRRIVGKVDQLLELCDELAARQAARGALGVGGGDARPPGLVPLGRRVPRARPPPPRPLRPPLRHPHHDPPTPPSHPPTRRPRPTRPPRTQRRTDRRIGRSRE
jgi:type I restriction enzyme S subunit